MPESDWVNASQAVAALGVSERSVRRFAGQLPGTARRKRQGLPVEFRLSALADLMGRTEVLTTLPGDARQLPESAGHEQAGTNRQAAGDAGQNEQLTALRAELAEERELAHASELRAAVAEARAELLATSLADTQAERDRWQEQAREALEVARAAQDQERAGRLLGSGRAVQQIEASGLTGGDSGVSEVSGGMLDTPSASEEPKRGFWARLWGRG